MAVTVDPAQLDGYADQLERNSQFFVSPLREYCAANCGHTDGMTGLLFAVKPIVELVQDAATSLLGSGERNLFQVATNLRSAATSYRAGDEAAAERLWRLLPRGRAPDGYVEQDDARHSGDFRDPSEPRLSPPTKEDTVQDAIKAARDEIGVIDDWLSKHIHHTLSGDVLPWLCGDWDTLRQNAAGYEALAGHLGVAVIGENLRYGVDSLSESWGSPAATQFDYTIRVRWLRAVDALVHYFDLNAKMFKEFALQAHLGFLTLQILLELFKRWVVDKILHILKLAVTVLFAYKIPQELVDLVAHVFEVLGEIKLIFETLKAAAENLVNLAQTIGAEATTVEDLWQGRFDPVVGG